MQKGWLTGGGPNEGRREGRRGRGGVEEGGGGRWEGGGGVGGNGEGGGECTGGRGVQVYERQAGWLAGA